MDTKFKSKRPTAADFIWLNGHGLPPKTVDQIVDEFQGVFEDEFWEEVLKARPRTPPRTSSKPHFCGKTPGMPLAPEEGGTYDRQHSHTHREQVMRSETEGETSNSRHQVWLDSRGRPPMTLGEIIDKWHGAFEDEFWDEVRKARPPAPPRPSKERK